jgi:mono/diheme cytochrome c family protein
MTIGLLMCGLPLYAGNRQTGIDSKSGQISPANGESWLNHLHRSFGDTSMGKTGRLGPPASEGAATPGWQLGLLTSSGPQIKLSGRELYRLNCQGCHGEAGLGAPPEIHSVIDPVRATSAALFMERMKQRGMDVSQANAQEMAKQAHESLLMRLRSGGQDMPAFPQLNDREINALVGYLKQLSGMGSAEQATVVASPARVGELIVKSTCHVCHDATGANPTPAQLEAGAIPPLESLVTRTDEVQFIRKVTSGAPILMGTPATLHRGRMPVFYYLSKDEVADAYLYLSNYPPSHLDAGIATAAAVQHESEDAGPPSSGSAPAEASAASVQTSAPVSQEHYSQQMSPLTPVFLLLAILGFVLTLLVGGLGFAAWELHRLGRHGDLVKADFPVESAEDEEFRQLVA